MTTYAGRYGPEGIEYPDGTHVVNRPVSVYQADGVSLAVLYADREKTSTIANPTTTDNLGNLAFYADPAFYQIATDGGTALELVVVHPDPAEEVSGGLTMEDLDPPVDLIVLMNNALA